ncbi:asparagine synthase C-terminal domain-containing protein [Belnapia mucosa]|uniref:asparagine synthase C-terminal domain-containing protein n=1 Tax=Belnapia mucosa TaxID=2804532 RepID=UPI001F277C7D|nr:asparagine synthase C-terminal domain-containing protein [Belnapia mucosa]
MTWRGLRRRANPDVLAHLLAFGYLPPDMTAFEGIATLEAGCCLELVPNAQPVLRRYWSLPEAAAEPRRRSPARTNGRPANTAAGKALRSRLAEACAGDQVPDAMLLFGDHAGPLLAAAVDGASLLRPSYRVQGPEDGEAVAIRGGAVLVGPAALAAAPAWLWETGEPAADPLLPIRHAILSSPALAQQTVGLDSGGDELVLSRPDYAQFAGMLEQLRSNPGAFRGGGFHGGAVMARDLVQLAAGYFTEAERLNLSGPGLLHTLAFAVADELGTGLETVPTEAAVDAAFRVDFARRLAAREAAAAWQASRGRPAPVLVPFLRREVVEWCVSRSQAVRRQLAAPAPAGAKSVPIDAWLRGPLHGFARDTFASSAFRNRGLYNLAYVDQLVEQCFEHGEPTGRLIWPLLCLELWFKTFIDRVPTKGLAPLTLERDASIIGVA